MLQEENMKNQDLTKYRKETIADLAKQFVQYQNFKTSSALNKIKSSMFKRDTLKRYFDSANAYIKYGTIQNSLRVDMKQEINSWLNTHLQPFTPTTEEKRDFKPKRSKQKTISVPKIPKKITEKFEYGVRFENTIKIFDNEKECNAFIEGARIFDTTSAVTFKTMSVIAKEL